jgi:hypothetical protein
MKTVTYACLFFMTRPVTPRSPSLCSPMRAAIFALTVDNSRNFDALKVPSIGPFVVDMCALVAYTDYQINRQSSSSVNGLAMTTHLHLDRHICSLKSKSTKFDSSTEIAHRMREER